MTKPLNHFLEDESGLVLSAELVLILTICVLGVIVGLASVQTSVVSEFQDLSLAFSGFNQSYMTPSFFGCRKWGMPMSFTSGSGNIDFYDNCACSIVGVAGGGTGGAGLVGGGVGGGVGSGETSGPGGYREIHTPGLPTQSRPLAEPTIPCETCPPGSIVEPAGQHPVLPHSEPAVPPAGSSLPDAPLPEAPRPDPNS